jgi:hypothetical protein
MMSKKYDKKLDMYMFMSIGFLIEKHNIVTCAFVFFWKNIHIDFCIKNCTNTDHSNKNKYTKFQFVCLLFFRILYSSGSICSLGSKTPCPKLHPSIHISLEIKSSCEGQDILLESHAWNSTAELNQFSRIDMCPQVDIVRYVIFRLKMCIWFLNALGC